jgi:hypothetical protein
VRAALDAAAAAAPPPPGVLPPPPSVGGGVFSAADDAAAAAAFGTDQHADSDDDSHVAEGEEGEEEEAAAAAAAAAVEATTPFSSPAQPPGGPFSTPRSHPGPPVRLTLRLPPLFGGWSSAPPAARSSASVAASPVPQSARSRRSSGGGPASSAGPTPRALRPAFGLGLSRGASPSAALTPLSSSSSPLRTVSAISELSSDMGDDEAPERELRRLATTHLALHICHSILPLVTVALASCLHRSRWAAGGGAPALAFARAATLPAAAVALASVALTFAAAFRHRHPALAHARWWPRLLLCAHTVTITLAECFFFCEYLLLAAHNCAADTRRAACAHTFFWCAPRACMLAAVACPCGACLYARTRTDSSCLSCVPCAAACRTWHVSLLSMTWFVAQMPLAQVFCLEARCACACVPLQARRLPQSLPTRTHTPACRPRVRRRCATPCSWRLRWPPRRRKAR